MADNDRDAPLPTPAATYRDIYRHTLLRLILVYFVPLLLLTVFFGVVFRVVTREADARHRASLAAHQAALLEVYLGDRLLNLTALTADPPLLLRPQRADLDRRLAGLREVDEAFVELSVLDAAGRVLGYAGALPQLESQVYADQDWFRRLLAGGSPHVITDAHLGFRQQPHYTVALKLEAAGQVRVLRTVLAPDVIARQMTAGDAAPWAGPAGGWLERAATNIWLYAALFCVIGGVAVALQARWVARQQYAAQLKERALARQLNQAAKLALVGELASGIAHEINNPLAVVAEQTGLIKDLLDPRFARELTPADLARRLDTIEKAVYRCADITRQLLGFVRHEDRMVTVFDVHGLIDELVDGFFGNELAVADIEVVKDYDPALGPVTGAPERLRQVLLNLLKNSADAITGRGSITIATRLQGERFRLSVADTGKGLTPEQLEQVFMPFFTTKPAGEGTGLGLSVSYGIIQGLGGALTAAGEPGRGAVFTVTLPLRAAASPTTETG